MYNALLHATWAPVNTRGQSRKRNQRCGGKLDRSSVHAANKAASEPSTSCEDLQADVVIVGGGEEATHVLHTECSDFDACVSFQDLKLRAFQESLDCVQHIPC